jgi:hypothetical protein
MAARGCPKGAKNVSTLWREAQVLVGDGGLVVDVADPLEVIDQVMKYFYGLGVHGAKSKAPVDEVQKCFNRALHAASIAAAYRHPKLSVPVKPRWSARRIKRTVIDAGSQKQMPASL